TGRKAPHQTVDQLEDHDRTAAAAAHVEAQGRLCDPVIGCEGGFRIVDCDDLAWAYGIGDAMRAPRLVLVEAAPCPVSARVEIACQRQGVAVIDFRWRPILATIERHSPHLGQLCWINLEDSDIELGAPRDEGPLGPDLTLADLTNGAIVSCPCV